MTQWNTAIDEALDPQNEKVQQIVAKNQAKDQYNQERSDREKKGEIWKDVHIEVSDQSMANSQVYAVGSDGEIIPHKDVTLGHKNKVRSYIYGDLPGDAVVISHANDGYGYRETESWTVNHNPKQLTDAQKAKLAELIEQDAVYFTGQLAKYPLDRPAISISTPYRTSLLRYDPNHKPIPINLDDHVVWLTDIGSQGQSLDEPFFEVQPTLRKPGDPLYIDKRTNIKNKQRPNASIGYPSVITEIGEPIIGRKLEEAQKGSEQQANPMMDTANKPQKDLAAWNNLGNNNPQSLLEIAQNKTSQREAEIATVLGLVGLTWSELNKQIDNLAKKLPYLDKAGLRLEKMTKVVGAEQAKIKIYLQKFIALQPAINVARKFMAEWVGTDIELQNTVFQKFLDRLSDENNLNELVQDASRLSEIFIETAAS